MDQLPEELIALVCEHCDHASLKNARLVNKPFKASADPLVFEHFYMGLFGYGLAKLDNLAQSPYAKHVKKFTIYSDILPDWPRDAWEKAIDFRPTFRKWFTSHKADFGDSTGMQSPVRVYDDLPRHHFTQEELDAGYAAFKHCYQQQISWRKQQYSLGFREFISRLPNLKEAYVACTTPFRGRTNTWPVWKGIHKTILVGPDDWMYSLDFQDARYADLSGQAALSLLAGITYRATFSGTAPVTKLSVHSPHLDSYQHLMNVSWPSVPMGLPSQRSVSHQLTGAFHNLTDLHIHVPHATVTARLSGLGLAHETITFLSSATQLRKLDLRYGDDELSPDDDSTHLVPLFDEVDLCVHWPHLVDLRLATNMPAEILISFLARHKASLKCLELRDMLVHDTDFVITNIPKVVELGRVYVECLWDDAEPLGISSVSYLCALSRGTDFDDPYEHSVKAYLLGQSDQVPEIERDGGLGEVPGWQDEDQPDEQNGGDGDENDRDEENDSDNDEETNDEGHDQHGNEAGNSNVSRRSNLDDLVLDEETIINIMDITRR